jgi:hypothetical protein
MNRRTKRKGGTGATSFATRRRAAQVSGFPVRSAVAVMVLVGSMIAVAGFDAEGAFASRSMNRRAGSSGAAGALVAPKAEIGQGVQLERSFVVERSGSSSGREAERGRAALALLRIRPADLYPGWTIAFRPARQSLLGMTLVAQRRVEIYVRLDRPLEGTAHDIAHELGHVTDVMYNDDDARAQYLALRDRATTPWWTCEACTDLQVGAGDFAETFALWAAPRFRFYSDLATEPTAEQLTAFGALLPEQVRANAGLTTV